MEPKKYWWINYTQHSMYCTPIVLTTVSEVHPFLFMELLEKRKTYEYKLQNWKLISVEEHNLFIEIKQNQNDRSGTQN